MHEIIITLDPSIRFGPKSNGLRQGFIVTFKLPKTVHLYFFFSLFFGSYNIELKTYRVPADHPLAFTALLHRPRAGAKFQT